MQLSKLQKEILTYIVENSGTFQHTHILMFERQIIHYGEKLHEHKTYSVWHEKLYGDFIKKVPKRKLVLDVRLLETNGFIWWDNGHWALTSKGASFCGVMREGDALEWFRHRLAGGS